MARVANHNTVIAFVILAAVVYYLVVVPMNTLIARSRREPPPDPATRQCPECLSVINIAARRCAYCTAEVPPVEPAGVPAADIAARPGVSLG